MSPKRYEQVSIIPPGWDRPVTGKRVRPATAAEIKADAEKRAIKMSEPPKVRPCCKLWPDFKAPELLPAIPPRAWALLHHYAHAKVPISVARFADEAGVTRRQAMDMFSHVTDVYDAAEQRDKRPRWFYRHRADGAELYGGAL